MAEILAEILFFIITVGTGFLIGLTLGINEINNRWANNVETANLINYKDKYYKVYCEDCGDDKRRAFLLGITSFDRAGLKKCIDEVGNIEVSRKMND